MSPERIDYYDSSEAPKANSLVPAVNVVEAAVVFTRLLARFGTVGLAGDPQSGTRSARTVWYLLPVTVR